MMKETNFCPVLLLLLLAVTPRNSCALSIASPGGTTEGAPANMSSTIADDKKEGANIIKSAMTWLKDNEARSSHFDKMILDFKNQIIKLPREEAEQRGKILEVLSKSKDRLKHLNTLLELAATSLKTYCITLIQSNDDNEPNEEQLKFAADKSVKDAKVVGENLKYAFTVTKEVQDLLSILQACSNDFNAKQDYEEKEIIPEPDAMVYNIPDLKIKVDEIVFNEKEKDTYKFIFLSHTFTNSNMRAATHEVHADIKAIEYVFDNQRKLKKKIKTAHTSATTLLPDVESVKGYLARHLDLINIWLKNLEASISDITACENYQERESQDIFKSSEYYITSGNRFSSQQFQS